jgi:4-hydroxythreonine-4-phosphate dehydrogenase
MTAGNASPPLALTMGEPAGIGGEITLKAWQSGRRGGYPFFVLDDAARLTALAGQLKLNVPVTEIGAPDEATGAFTDALPVLPCPLAADAVPGQPEPANVPAVVASIDRAVALAREGRAAAVVTNPIHKATMYAGGFAHPGHTEYLGALCGEAATPQMMLAVPGLRVVPVTVHVALSEVAARLTSELIVAAGRITAEALKSDFDIAEPRLVVAALNPHAGEAGALGPEESAVIMPAIETLRNDGIEASGPAPADTLFHARARETYDAALCMYHDQALIPLKTIDFDHGVNITLGLPFVRTSPDHGTALPIAGRGEANPSSLIAAIAMAGDMATRRRAHEPAHATS